MGDMHYDSISSQRFHSKYTSCLWKNVNKIENGNLIKSNNWDRGGEKIVRKAGKIEEKKHKLFKILGKCNLNV